MSTLIASPSVQRSPLTLSTSLKEAALAGLPKGGWPHAECSMHFKVMLIALGIAMGGAVNAASATTFRFAFQGDLKSLDSYTLNETFSLGLLGNVYEGLVKRDKKLAIVPGLAERWEMLEPTRWRFYLRRGVKFQHGESFTADDVVFSAERVRANGSDLKTRLPADAKVIKVDDYIVDFLLTKPNPILPYEWDTWYMMSKQWSEANNSVMPQPASGQQLSYAALHANGTGPFMITEHQAGVRTVFKPNPNWWGTPEHNFDEVVFTTIANDATRVAALLSGDVDWIDPVPLQDIARVNANPTTGVLSGSELRTIFLGFDQFRDELKYASVKGKNPFKDIRVRKAFYQAIDIEAIKSRVMRGMATPSALLISPQLFSRSGEFKRWPYDPDAAKRLLAEAGYPDGFEVTMDCPNDRYVNDEAICQAVAAMLARIGVKIDLLAQPKAKYFAKVLASGGYDTSFYLLGWTPGSLDSWNIFNNIIGCRDAKGKGGMFNLGGYCNPKITELADQVLVEPDKVKRDALIAQAFAIEHQDVSHIPLHQQSLVWGVSKNIRVVQRPDNQVLFYWFRRE
jgi:peptide/nickel transport system substrate-binding protein